MKARRPSTSRSFFGRIRQRMVNLLLPYLQEAKPLAAFVSRRRRSKSRRPKDKLARAGEKLAARYLQGLGYQILARNLLLGGGEVDLVAQNGQCIVFVEVKTRKSLLFGRPQEAVTLKQRRQLSKLAHRFINQRRLETRPVRFDIIAILWPPGEQPQIEHLIDAFDAS